MFTVSILVLFWLFCIVFLFFLFLFSVFVYYVLLNYVQISLFTICWFAWFLCLRLKLPCIYKIHIHTYLV